MPKEPSLLQIVTMWADGAKKEKSPDNELFVRRDHFQATLEAAKKLPHTERLANAIAEAEKVDCSASVVGVYAGDLLELCESLALSLADAINKAAVVSPSVAEVKPIEGTPAVPEVAKAAE